MKNIYLGSPFSLEKKFGAVDFSQQHYLIDAQSEMLSIQEINMDKVDLVKPSEWDGNGLQIDARLMRELLRKEWMIPDEWNGKVVHFYGSPVGTHDPGIGTSYFTLIKVGSTYWNMMLVEANRPMGTNAFVAILRD